MTRPPLPRLLARAWIALLLLYIGYRAFTLSMTCDEAWTAKDLPYPGLFDYITPEFIAGLNVHLLNTWLINLCMSVFGEHDFAVRLPALAGGTAYLVGAYSLCARLLRSWRLPAGVVLLTANPYLLDFLSIGRGYALGLGCLMLGLPGLLAVRGKTENPPWHLVWFALAALANLSFLYLYLAAVALEAGRALPWFQGPRKRPWPGALGRAAGPILATLAGLALVYGQAMRIATRNNEHWWGSPDGFVNGGLASLVQVTLYHIPISPDAARLVVWAVLGLTAGLVPAVVAARPERQTDAPARRALYAALALFCIVWAGVTLEHQLFGTPYLIERGMFFIFPTLLLIPACAAECLAATPGRAALGHGALVVLCAAMLANWAVAANPDHTATWRDDACSRPFMERIRAETYPRNFTREPLRIAASHMAEHTISYYVRHMRLAFVEAVDGLDRLDAADYAIMPARQAASPAIAARFEAIAQCPANGLALLRRR